MACEWTINHFEVNDTIKQDSRENRISGENYVADFEQKKGSLPLALHEEVMPPSMVAMRGPGIVPPQWKMIEMAFVCEN